MRRAKPQAFRQSFRDLVPSPCLRSLKSSYQASRAWYTAPPISPLDTETAKLASEPNPSVHASNVALQRLIEAFFVSSEKQKTLRQSLQNRLAKNTFDTLPSQHQDSRWKVDVGQDVAAKSTASINTKPSAVEDFSFRWVELPIHSDEESTTYPPPLEDRRNLRLWPDPRLRPKPFQWNIDFQSPVSTRRSAPDRSSSTEYLSLWNAQSRVLSHVLKALDHGDTLQPTVVLESIWELLAELVTNHYQRSSIDEESYNLAKTQFLAIWSFALQMFGPKLPGAVLEGSEPNDWGKALRFAHDNFSESMNVQTRFKTMFPVLSKDKADLFSVAATATFSYLVMDPKNFAKDSDFICLLGHLLLHSNASLSHRAGHKFKNIFPTSPRYRFLKTLKNCRRHAEIVLAASTTSVSYPSTQKLVQHFKRRLVYDMDMGVTGHLAETLRDWTKTFRLFYNHWLSRQEIPYLTTILTRALMKAAYKDGNVQKVKDIWRQVLYKGYTPRMEDYTARMAGAGTLRQLSEVEKNWSELCSNWEPDQWAHGARVIAYIDCGEPEKAIDIYAEHVNAWVRKATQKGSSDFGEIRDLPGVPKFRIKTINAILTSLSQSGNKGMMRKVIHLAQGMGVKLDRMTYNTLMNATDVDDGSEAALKILDELTNAGIEPGRTTYNILVNSIYRNGQDSKEEEWAKVKKLLDHMESNNISVGKDTIATCLKLLLWKHQDLEKALEIFDEATTRFGTANHVMVTVLINYLFSNPTEANLSTIRDLWSNVSKGKLDADSLLWEQMACGYASINEIDSMSETLSGMIDRKLKIRWSTLFECLNATIRNQKWHDARIIVKIARIRNGGKLTVTDKDEQFQKQFWSVASMHGLSIVDKSKVVENEQTEYKSLRLSNRST